ncbi:MAG: helix-turn-helix transcriptional regulator [Bryobacterales bacterium]|nr:helix-turn-helix transcriptional regulator [Bryobacterales bacterium]
MKAISLAERLRACREAAGFSLEELASRAKISKTYLWELEKDAAGEKKPSADVLLRVASALSVTIADLLSLPTVQVNEEAVELSPSLREFRERMQRLDAPLSQQDLHDLAVMKFRGGQPQSADEWHQLYLTLLATASKRRPQ